MSRLSSRQENKLKNVVEDEDAILVSRDCIQRIRVMAAGLETLDPMEIQTEESWENMDLQDKWRLDRRTLTNI